MHPGPAPWAPSPAPGPGGPAWWPALTSYVAQMQAAWLAFRTWARPAHPRLRACFAMLAGLAPLHVERLASRGVDLDARDPGVFLDTSSYGPRAVAAVAAAAGAGALVHGSDRPVVSPAAAPAGARPHRPRARPQPRAPSVPHGGGCMIAPHVLPHSPPADGDALEPERLRALVDDLAGAPAAWAARVRHDPDERLFELLWRDERVEVWLICWTGEDHDTGFHDHDESHGALAVVRGSLVEERLVLSGVDPAAAAPGRLAGLPGLPRAPGARGRRDAGRLDPRLLAPARGGWASTR